ncbi:hypothetical protein AVEN_217325-1 [Araneus ventricosus]|uniref:Uncharacterized protein n=1 Tax=Araneus ventricosus TaxID=182803 RepID=A0A4Y2JR48_ARAVE|nr:hypothetical protein AVEN_217325-1 [Araneus ventricosus]
MWTWCSCNLMSRVNYAVLQMESRLIPVDGVSTHYCRWSLDALLQMECRCLDSGTPPRMSSLSFNYGSKSQHQPQNNYRLD